VVLWIFIIAASLAVLAAPRPVHAQLTLDERVAALESLLSNFSRTGNDIYVTGANLHVRSGSGQTDGPVNGLGNLIVGYNELRPATGDNDRSGSHNIVVGSLQNYSSYGGLVAGQWNTLSDQYATISGGLGNVASGGWSSVCGGASNQAMAVFATVAGGNRNRAEGGVTSISGGMQNVTRDNMSTVSGGSNNTASGYGSTVGGGRNIEATVDYSFASPVKELGEDTVGNLELKENIILGDPEDSGEFQVLDRNGKNAFEVTTAENVCANCHSGAGVGNYNRSTVVIGERDMRDGLIMDADLVVKDPYGIRSDTTNDALYFDASTATLTLKMGAATTVSPYNASQSTGANGFVKAWAFIDGYGDGRVIDCYKCSRAGFSKIGEGVYKIDFSPAGPGIEDRPHIFQPLGITDEPLVSMFSGVRENGRITVLSFVVGTNNFNDSAFFVLVF